MKYTAIYTHNLLSKINSHTHRYSSLYRLREGALLEKESVLLEGSFHVYSALTVSRSSGAERWQRWPWATTARA